MNTVFVAVIITDTVTYTYNDNKTVIYTYNDTNTIIRSRRF